MRTNIVVDDTLMAEALKLSQLKTKRAAVETGGRLLIQIKKQERIKSLRGKLNWDGDLEKMRLDQGYWSTRPYGSIISTTDVIIGTYCIVEGLPLLHDGRGFDPMAHHLSLKILSPSQTVILYFSNIIGCITWKGAAALMAAGSAGPFTITRTLRAVSSTGLI